MGDERKDELCRKLTKNVRRLLFEEDVDTADYLELQRKRIEQIQIDLGI